MSQNEEVILGFCQLPEMHDNSTGSNGAATSSLPEESQKETRIIHVQQDESVESTNTIKIEMVDHSEVAFQTSETNVKMETSETNDAEKNEILNTAAAEETSSEPVKVSTNLVDFINQAGSELMDGTTLDEDESERPAKKRRKPLPKGIFQCAECRTFLEDFTTYASHMNTHSDVPLFTCQKCLYMFQDASLYEAHVAQTCKAASNAKDKECAVCRKSFKYDSHLREHIICMHNKTPLFKCPICGQNITSWRRSIDRHMANHANNLKCPTCGFKGDNMDALEAHLLENGETHLKCKTCEYATCNRQEFFNHVLVHIPKVDVLEPMVCFKCQHRFQRTSEFNNHVRLFCKFRDLDAAQLEEAKASAVTVLPTTHSISDIQQEASQEIVQAPNDTSKQIISLPEGVNNNTFIPITLSAGTDELGNSLGQTVILIPQILLMPNAGGMPSLAGLPGLTLDGSTEVVGGVQNDQVIYLECVKPEQQQGVMPMFEVPSDKSVHENAFANHVLQNVQSVSQIEPVHGVQSIPVIQSLPAAPQISALHPLQTGQASEQPTCTNIKVEQEEVEKEVEDEVVTGDLHPPIISLQSNVATSLPLQNATSIVSSVSQNSSTVDSVIQQVVSASATDSGMQQVVDNGGPPALVCSVCHELLKDTETYESHVKQHEKAKSKPIKPTIVVQKKGSVCFNCEQCGQGFAAKHHLEQHTITFHSDVAGIVCPVCRVGMASEKMSLNEHLAKAHNLRVEPSGKLTECTES